MERSYPTSGGDHIDEDGVIRPLTEEEAAAAADARSALTPEDMQRFAAEHAATLAAKADQPKAEGKKSTRGKRE